MRYIFSHIYTMDVHYLKLCCSNAIKIILPVLGFVFRCFFCSPQDRRFENRARVYFPFVSFGRWILTGGFLFKNEISLRLHLKSQSHMRPLDGEQEAQTNDRMRRRRKTLLRTLARHPYVLYIHTHVCSILWRVLYAIHTMHSNSNNIHSMRSKIRRAKKMKRRARNTLNE